MKKKFMREAKVSGEDAEFYLEDHDYDYAAAMKQYLEDGKSIQKARLGSVQYK